MSVIHGRKRQGEREILKALNELRGAGVAAADRLLTPLEKLALIAESVQEQPYPEQKPKEGYIWRRYYDTQGGAIAWELVPDPDYRPSEGTYTSPITYIAGMTVEAGLFYTDGTAVWECIRTGTPEGFGDRGYFDIIE